MGFMFAYAQEFNQSLSNWDVSNVTDMPGMFHGAAKFNSPINTWNVGNVTNMAEMFSVTIFNQPLHKWNTGNVTNMSIMFAASKFNQPIETWNVSNVTTMELTFYDNKSFNQSLNDWKVDNVKNMYGMFRNATEFDQPLYKWNVRPQTNTIYMFTNCVKFLNTYKNSIYMPYRLKDWDIEKEDVVVPPEGMEYVDCVICSNSLNNVDGPGKSQQCQYFCDDVVEICVNHHKVHRGCILSSCNAPKVDLAIQMGMPENSSQWSLARQERRNNCPICQMPLITECDNFKNRKKVPRVPTEQLFERIQAGGKRKRKIRTRNQRRKGNKRTKRANKNN
jgi:surface protein